MSNAKNYTDWFKSKLNVDVNENTVHGTPGEDSSDLLLEVSDDLLCSTKIQEKLYEVYNEICNEMKGVHEDKTKFCGEDYLTDAMSLVEKCNEALYEVCNSKLSSKVNEGKHIMESKKQELEEYVTDVLLKITGVDNLTKPAFQKIDKVWYVDFTLNGANHRSFAKKNGEGISTINMDTNRKVNL